MTTPMTHLGWKVLRVEVLYGARTSAFATTGAVTYPRGTVVHPLPGCGPLTLFNDYNQAKYFSRLLNHDMLLVVPVKYEVWEGDDAANKSGYKLWQPKAGPSVRGENLSTFGRTLLRDRVETVVRKNIDLPYGTVLASAIVCLE